MRLGAAATQNLDPLHRLNLPQTPTTSRIEGGHGFQLDKQVAFSHAYEGSASETPLSRHHVYVSPSYSLQLHRLQFRYHAPEAKQQVYHSISQRTLWYWNLAIKKPSGKTTKQLLLLSSIF
jgi:hypothetical protein